MWKYFNDVSRIGYRSLDLYCTKWVNLDRVIFDSTYPFIMSDLFRLLTLYYIFR